MKIKQLLLLFATLCFSTYAEENADATEKTQEQIQFEKQIQSCIDVLEETGLVDSDSNAIYRYCRAKVYGQNNQLGRYSKRVLAEKVSEFNPFVITPHLPSYILPVTYTNNFNHEVYEIYDIPSDDPNEAPINISDNMEAVEAKYQISLKVPLVSEWLFIQGDELYFAMTVQSWWQVYSSNISKPFRETNYAPEIFYLAPLPWTFNGGNFGFTVHFQHQSNGQFQGLSRSWNRIHASLVYDKENWTLAFKPWYRLPEDDDRENELDPDGDDNPDIEDYLGNYEIFGAYAFNDKHKLTSMLRQNWSTGNGAIGLNYTFPLFNRLRGMVQYFNGYGESLIDYNHRQQKIGVGLALTDIF